MPRDNAYILDMLRTVRRLAGAANETDWERFRADWKVQSAMLHQLCILGEAVKRLSAPFRAAHGEIPWKQIAGMRDYLIHRYDDINLEEVWRTLTQDIPALLSFLERVAPDEDSRR